MLMFVHLSGKVELAHPVIDRDWCGIAAFGNDPYSEGGYRDMGYFYFGF